MVAAPLPSLVRAVQHHTPALSHRFAQMALRVEIARSYNPHTGAVTLRLTCDPQSDTLFRDERQVTLAARDILEHAGFFVRMAGLCRILLTGYYGSEVAA